MGTVAIQTQCCLKQEESDSEEEFELDEDYEESYDGEYEVAN